MIVSSPSSSLTSSSSSPQHGKQLSSSPRGNKHGRNHPTIMDLLCAGFLRHFRFLLAAIVGMIIVRTATMDPYQMAATTTSASKAAVTVATMTTSGTGTTLLDGGTNNNHHHFTPTTTITTDTTSTRTKTKTAVRGSIPPAVGRPSTSSLPNDESRNGGKTRTSPNTESTTTITISNNNSSNNNNSTRASGEERPMEPQSTTSNNDNNNNNSIISLGENETRQPPQHHPNDDDDESLLSRYKASNAPVILDGWNRTVQVHLVFDISGHLDAVDPASKSLLAAVQRSQFTQLTTVTFVTPSIETMDNFFPRNPNLPLLYLINWGSMHRNCNRLQMVLEHLQQLEHHQRTTTTTTTMVETEEPYFLLLDSSGSTRQTGCSYLFEHTDGDRIRLAKRSIVQNRYYDRAAQQIHTGELAPNEWEDTRVGYDQPILQAPVSLRESFVTGVRNITNGGPPITNEDSKRPLDVGFFWKSGDYSHYGFYRREIAKVVKTLHHSSIRTSISNASSKRLMENHVGIAYTDEKGMEAGNVQFKYIDRLLACKIVVIAQRDDWEDHYRLMESLASGALVMTDAMVALPEGILDGVNIVVYETPKHLKDLIKHFLKPEQKKERKAIATRGYKLAMGYHRCWHNLERLLFGKPLTNAGMPDAPAPAKEKYPNPNALDDTDTPTVHARLLL